MIDFETVKQEATGKWLSIFRSLGIEIREDGKHAPCVLCGGKDRARVDRDVAERGGYYCGQCGPHDGVSIVQKVLGVDFKGAMEAIASVVGTCEKNVVPVEKRITPEQLRQNFEGGNKITAEDVAGKYLQSRGLTIMPPDSLWYSTSCWESETKQNQKAMIGVIQMPDGMAVCVHRTYLDPDGKKLDIKSPKKLSPALVNSISGGAIRLFPVEGKTLGVAEGIETAIAAHEEINIPVWSTVSSTLMEKFVPPEGIESLVVVADNDSNFAGQKAAYILANRAAIKHKLNVTVYVPEKVGEDWLDVMNSSVK